MAAARAEKSGATKKRPEAGVTTKNPKSARARKRRKKRKTTTKSAREGSSQLARHQAYERAVQEAKARRPAFGAGTKEAHRPPEPQLEKDVEPTKDYSRIEQNDYSD